MANVTAKELVYSSTSTYSNKFDLNKERAEFLNALPGVIDILAKSYEKFRELPEAEKWMRKVLDGNLIGGKKIRGLITVMAYKMLEKPENITEETLRLARTLGWCAEIFQAYGLVLDDISDGSTTRRGMPCWYRREDVGIANAVNDATLIHCCLLQILRANFENSPNYENYFHNINETLFHTSVGQHLDIMTGLTKKNFNLFTMEHYDAIVKNKTAYYTYRLPISLGYMLSNKYNEETHKVVDEISMKLGRLFQMQDDYIDCYGDEYMTGKIGTDIQEGKCSWLAVKALQHCNPDERAVFTVCYGSKEPAHIERIKDLYNQLKIPQLYKEEENEMYNEIVQKIQDVSAESEREFFLQVLHVTYGRKR
uniref:Farnesyl pyrophosphate synthase n=1 Tax=Heliothis virescens TaxID=7102 RepID=A0A2A4IUH1_HELVI